MGKKKKKTQDIYEKKLEKILKNRRGRSLKGGGEEKKKRILKRKWLQERMEKRNC